MSIKPEVLFPGKSTPADANYTYGSARDITTPGDGTGTPWKQEVINDLWGFLQRFLNEAAIVPSGVPDTILASDYYDAITAVSWDRANHTGTQAIGTITGHTKAVHDALNIDADTLDSQHGSYYQNRVNHTGTQTVSTLSDHNKAVHDALGISSSELDGQNGAYYLARTNHTGTQALATITGHDKAAHDALNIDADTLDGQHGAYYQNSGNQNAGTLPAARFNDTTHGTRAGGALHAVATAVANGFQSAADKAKSDALPTRYRNPTGFTWTTNTIKSYAHGLTLTNGPLHAYLAAQCTTGEHNYAAGDWAFNLRLADFSAGEGPANVRVNGTTVYFAGGDQVPSVIDQVAAATADWKAITPANWDLYLFVVMN